MTFCHLKLQFELKSPPIIFQSFSGLAYEESTLNSNLRLKKIYLVQKDNLIFLNKMDEQSPYHIDKDEAKIIALILLGFGSFIVGVFPACINRRSLLSFPLTLTGLLCFGAGVLMSTALVHMLPEVREIFKLNNLDTKFII